MSTSQKELKSTYSLGRNYGASHRLAAIQLLFHAQFGYLLHPAIQLPEDKANLKVADVGTGTGIFLAELASELPTTAVLDGFDISAGQYPPLNWYPKNVTLSTLDIFQPVPEELKGKYDVVHLRFFMCVANDDDVQVVVNHLAEMLKPGGYIQWVERDFMSKLPPADSFPDRNPHAMINDYHLKILPKRSWINNLPKYFEGAGVSVLSCEGTEPLPIYRKPWNEDTLLGWAELGNSIKDDEARDWHSKLHAEAAAEASKGWWGNMELVVCVGQKRK